MFFFKFFHINLLFPLFLGVQYCPNSTTYSLGFECRPCHEACFEGCTGPGDNVGNNGCNKCLYGLRDELGNVC